MLIADSGSTKTDWRFINAKGEVRAFRSEGYNPRIVSAEQIEKSIRAEVLSQLDGQDPGELFFYGAGCGTGEMKNVVKDVFRKIFPSVPAEVHSDMLGAARSLCGPEKGIAAILGTGSNSCSFDGKEIIVN